VIGHSTGGQQLGLAENVGRVNAALFIAVSTGYWRGMPALYKWLTLALWKIYLPLASRVYGYAPAKKIKWGENLPVGVAREWGAWCLAPEYLAAYFDESGYRATPDGAPFGPTHFDKAQFPIRAYYFSDDPIATRSNAAPMLSLFSNSEIETCWIDPGAIDVSQIGHLGFFRASIGKPLWNDALSWLRSHSIN
jgi:predicted alpha/beta hydrolase